MPPYSVASALILLVATLATLGLLLAVGLLTRFGATNWRWLIYAALVICSLIWPALTSQLPDRMILFLGSAALVLLRYREAGLRAITSISGFLLLLAVAAYVCRFIQLVMTHDATGTDANLSVALVRLAVLLCNVWIPVMVLAPDAPDLPDSGSAWMDLDSVGRWAHGTFIVLLPGVGEPDCAERAVRLRSALARVLSPSGQTFTCSVAGATATATDTYEELVARVDARMLSAMAAGPNGLACPGQPARGASDN